MALNAPLSPRNTISLRVQSGSTQQCWQLDTFSNSTAPPQNCTHSVHSRAIITHVYWVHITHGASRLVPPPSPYQASQFGSRRDCHSPTSVASEHINASHSINTPAQPNTCFSKSAPACLMLRQHTPHNINALVCNTRWQRPPLHASCSKAHYHQPSSFIQGMLVST
jgi:hypothetical protein